MPYTYILEISDGRSYIGYRARYKTSPEEDFDYHGSCRSLNKAIKDGKVTILNKIILDVYDTAKEAINGEIILHDIFNVAKSLLFWNRCKSINNGFSTAGIKTSEETKAKLSAVSKGKPKKPHSDETKAKMSAAQKNKPGKPHSDETKAKIAALNKGRICSEKTKAKMSAAKKGVSRKPFSDETKAKLSAAQILYLRKNRPLNYENPFSPSIDITHFSSSN